MGMIVDMQRWKKIQNFRDRTKPGNYGFASIGAISTELMRDLKRPRH